MCIWDIDDSKMQKAKEKLNSLRPGHVSAVNIDITNEESVLTASETGADIMVCSAGITGRNDVTWEYSLAEWKRVVDIDLTGTFLCNKAVLPYMIEQGYGRIVNISSVAGKDGNPNAPAYVSVMTDACCFVLFEIAMDLTTIYSFSEFCQSWCHCLNKEYCQRNGYFRGYCCELCHSRSCKDRYFRPDD